MLLGRNECELSFVGIEERSLSPKWKGIRERSLGKGFSAWKIPGSAQQHAVGVYLIKREISYNKFVQQLSVGCLLWARNRLTLG